MTARFRVHIEGLDPVPIDRVLVVGRSTLSDLLLDHPSVSRVHCRLVPRGNQVFLEDMGSANGSRVNGAAVEGSVPVKSNDVITVGTYSIQILEDSAGAAAGGGLQLSYTIPEGVLSAWLEEEEAEPVVVDMELVKLTDEMHPDAIDATAFQDCVRLGDTAVVLLSGNLRSLDRRDEILTLLHQTLRSAAGQDPDQILSWLNQALFNCKARASAVCARLELEKRRLHFAAAAHWMPFVLRSSGRVLDMEDHPSLDLGQLPTARFIGEQTELLPGETAVLVSQGFPEAAGGGDVAAGVTAIVAAIGGQPTSVKAVAERLTAALNERAGSFSCRPHSCAVCFGLG